MRSAEWANTIPEVSEGGADRGIWKQQIFTIKGHHQFAERHRGDGSLSSQASDGRVVATTDVVDPSTYSSELGDPRSLRPSTNAGIGESLPA